MRALTKMSVWFEFNGLNPKTKWKEKKKFWFVFSEIGSPSALGVRRDDRERARIVIFSL